MMTKKQFLILGLISIVFLTMCTTKPESSQWRGPNRDGVYPEKNLLDEWPEEGPELLWKYEELGAGYSSATLGGDKVFTLGTADSVNTLFAFDLKGELLWKKVLGPAWMKTYPGIRNTPLIVDAKGYVYDGLGVMHCFSVADGSILWKRDLLAETGDKNSQHGVHENLVIDGQKLLCTLGGKESNVLALDKDTGETIWVSKGLGQLNAYCSSTIIEHNGVKYYITMTFNSLLSIKLEDGELAWSQELTEPKFGIHANTPLYKDGKLFIVEGYRYGSKMFQLADNGLNAELIWKMDSVDVQMSDAVLINDDIFAASITGKKWFCLDWNTGDVKFSTDKLREGCAIAADGKLFIQTNGGEMAMVKVENNDFTILGKLKVPGKRGDHFTTPVIRDGILYVRYKETICAYDIQKKS